MIFLTILTLLTKTHISQFYNIANLPVGKSASVSLATEFS